MAVQVPLMYRLLFCYAYGSSLVHVANHADTPIKLIHHRVDLKLKNNSIMKDTPEMEEYIYTASQNREQKSLTPILDNGN
ncbi:hypothetical protein Nepgr_011454 [Nepenthes gracilis]|uniref:Uncharacterized protein n=1 Tax=Nepenthes gracilis TaxID=150966 RepID=A0AAD3XLZ0_NEPGR|nr:hypothetical protein Nepgr_011454 [Nepenthes gracilis]